MKIDLHVHSKFSKRPSQWILQKISCPESFTEPTQVYKTAKEKGMSLVTLSDHNTIDGALEIAHLPGAFISEEITSYFPQDGCKVHILALNITEAQHLEIQKIRENVFDLVAYLTGESIVHILAHPLYGVNDRLTISHFEQMLLLFKNFELNGSRNHAQNQTLTRVLMSLSSLHIDQLSNQYDYQPLFPDPWQKNLTGGSDDHSGLNIARTYTRIPGATDLCSFLNRLETGGAQVESQASSPKTMAHNLYGIAYQFYRNRFNLDRHTGKDQLLTFLDQSLMPESSLDDSLISRLYKFINSRKSRRTDGMPQTMMGLIREETERLFKENPSLLDIGKTQGENKNREQIWFDFVNQISGKVLSQTGNLLLGQVSGANIFNMFQTLGSVGGLYTLMAPYFVSFAHFAKDNEINAAVLNRFAPSEPGTNIAKVRLGHFTDTFYDVNGVAQTLQHQIRTASDHDKDLTIITCEAAPGKMGDRVKNFSPIGVYEIPEYTEQKLYSPPFLDMLNYCFTRGFTHIHSATPGPIGLAALAVARILKLPITATYHTQFPQYAQYLTGDDFIEDMTWKFMIWYYDQMDQIYVSSQNSFDELAEKGIAPEKIKLIPRGIDTNAFHPAKGNGILNTDYGVKTDCVKFLYVGRLSKEKNMPLLADAFLQLCRHRDDVHLTIVGDGPYADKMKHRLKGSPVTFTGYLSGPPLHQVYASADAFVFPSTTDTFGNVVLEAQASGLPVIVSDLGGPCENMVDHRTGFVVKSDDVQALVKAMETLATDKERLKNMGIQARAYMENRSFDSAFIQSWELYKQIDSPLTSQKASPKASQQTTQQFSKAG